jgi:hypothetical protein
MRDENELEKVKDLLKKRKVNSEESIEFLDSLIEASDDDVFREECIKMLSAIAPESNKAYNYLESYLVSDANPKIRASVIEILAYNFLEKSENPFLWTINNDRSPIVLSKLAEIAENQFKNKYHRLYDIFNSKFQDLASNLGIVRKEFKFILDIENQLTKNRNNHEIKNEMFEFYKNLSKIGDEPWLKIDDYHIKMLNFNYFNWKFLRESSELMRSISKLEDVEFFLSIIKKYEIEYSNIKSIPKSIGNLSELRSLNVSYNNLRIVPESIIKLTNLRKLNLSHNHLRDLPDLSNLYKLNELDLSFNRFNQIPESVKELTNSLKIYLNNNPIS